MEHPFSDWVEEQYMVPYIGRFTITNFPNANKWEPYIDSKKPWKIFLTGIKIGEEDSYINAKSFLHSEIHYMYAREDMAQHDYLRVLDQNWNRLNLCSIDEYKQ